MAVTARLKVLVSAYACSPYRGSEPGVGWGFVSELAKHHDLWVIVEEEKFRSEIEHYLNENPDFPRSVHFCFLRKIRNRFLRKLWPPSYYWYYRRWHRDALQLAKELHSSIRFDLVHQLTMVGYREPGYLWQLEIPFVWGPIGGMGVVPWNFLHTMGKYYCIYYFAYNLYNLIQVRYMRRPKLAAARAGSGLLAATLDNKLGAWKYWGCNSHLISEVGTPKALPTRVERREPGSPLTLVWVGAPFRRKSLNLALWALARVDSEFNCHLHILGGDPEIGEWRQFVKRLRIDARVTFHGQLSRQEVLDKMRLAHVMLITSLRDLTSTVTIEALSSALPIICVDGCGFSHVVNEKCGIKIPPTAPRSTVAGLAGAIERLARDEEYRFGLSCGALDEATRYSWAEKIAQLNAIYARRVEDGC